MSRETLPKPTRSARFLRRMGGIMNRAVSSVSQRLHVAMANMWRDSYNPLRSLTIMRAVHLLEDGERGAYADLMWTYRYIEMQDATLGALVERRTSAIQELAWDIVIRKDVPDNKKAVAAKQEAALRSAYKRIKNFSAATENLAMASFRGFTRLEKVRNQAGQIIELASVDQWFWVRGGLYGAWKYNRDAKFGTISGEDVDESRFVCREVARPINRIALVAFVRKGLSQKDWDAFIEAYGIPAVFIIMPEDIPEDKEDEYFEAAEQVGSDARGALPHGSDVKTVDNGARGNNPFKDHIAYQDEQVVLRGTGGLLTMLAVSGTGTLAGSAHTETFKAIARGEAKEISEILRAAIDAEVIESVTPGEEAWAEFQLAANEEQDTSQVVKDVSLLKRSGFDPDPAQIEEKTGYRLAPAATATTPTQQPVRTLLNRLMQEAGRTHRNDYKRTPEDMLRITTRILNRAERRASGWKKFPHTTGTLGIPRSIMPQIKSENRAAMVNFLRARGVDYTKTKAKPADLKPTQAEYSPEKVQASRDYQGTQRVILISSDNHIVDGHHQYMAALQDGPNVEIPVFKIDAPIMAVIGLTLQMGSTGQALMNRNSGDQVEEPALQDAALQRIRTALATDLKPLGAALEGALKANDVPALAAALKKISEQMPDFMESPDLEAALGDELTKALLGEDEDPTETADES